MTRVLNAAVLLSGTGRTLENLLRNIDAGEFPVSIVAVASNKANARGLQIAQEARVPQRVFARTDFDSRVARDAAMIVWLREHAPDVIALAGYLALLDLGEARGIPVLNIHPALLPKFGGKGFYGDRVHAAVLEAGESQTGATVHLVDEAYDRGPIVDQEKVDVMPGDDVHRLANRVFEAECKLYPSVLRRVAEGKLDLKALGRAARG